MLDYKCYYCVSEVSLTSVCITFFISYRRHTFTFRKLLIKGSKKKKKKSKIWINGRWDSVCNTSSDHYVTTFFVNSGGEYLECLISSSGNCHRSVYICILMFVTTFKIPLIFITVFFTLMKMWLDIYPICTCINSNPLLLFTSTPSL